MVIRKEKTRPPDILTPRAVQNFVLQKASTNFVLKELSKLKVTKVSGPDGITARLLKDAADQLLLNQSCIWLTLLFQQDLFQPSGRRHE